MTDENITLNPMLRDVMSRVSQVGLHKVASQLYEQDINLHSAVQIIGSELLRNRAKFARVHDGLQALDALNEEGVVDIKPIEKHAFMGAMANMARQGGGALLQGAQKGWQGLGNLGAQAGGAVMKRGLNPQMQKVVGAAEAGAGQGAGLVTGQGAQALQQVQRGANIGRNVAQGGALLGTGAMVS